MNQEVKMKKQSWTESKAEIMLKVEEARLAAQREERETNDLLCMAIHAVLNDDDGQAVKSVRHYTARPWRMRRRLNVLIDNLSGLEPAEKTAASQAIEIYPKC